MMEKKLENYIKSHQTAFDDQNPPENLWWRIQEKLEHNRPSDVLVRPLRTSKTKGFLKIAATLLIAGMLGISLYFFGRQKGYEDYARINPDLAAAKLNVQSIISQKKDSIASFTSNNPELDTEFSRALTYMEENYNALKNELPGSPDRERILEAMIVNLQTQAEVLNQQLYILHQVTSNKNEKL